MPEPELHVRDLTPPVLVAVCDSGRHHAHPGDTCEDIDQLQAVFRGYFQLVVAEAYEEAERRLLFGDGSGEIRGFPSTERISIPYPLSDAEAADHGFVVGEPEPTSVERAFAILAPELRRCPLYRAGPPALRGPDWKATL